MYGTVTEQHPQNKQDLGSIYVHMNSNALHPICYVPFTGWGTFPACTVYYRKGTTYYRSINMLVSIVRDYRSCIRSVM